MYRNACQEVWRLRVEEWLKRLRRLLLPADSGRRLLRLQISCCSKVAQMIRLCFKTSEDIISKQIVFERHDLKPVVWKRRVR